MFSALPLLVVAFLSSCLAQDSTFPVVVNSTSPIQLAVRPACGTLDSDNFTEINTGINLSATRTIVAFGDSWTSNGANGSVPVPPVMYPPSPSAGSMWNSNRRAANGYMWVEDLANGLGGVRLLNFAWGGAIIDNYAWNTTSPNNATSRPRTDFVSESQLFFQRGKLLDALVPSTTLYTVAFGINDNGQYGIAGGDWELAAATYIATLGQLQAAGARNIVIHGMYRNATNVNILQSKVFRYLRESRSANGTNFAFVNLERLFGAIAATPAAFGYAGNPTCLVSANTIVGGCDDPDRSVFWIPGHPSYVTHRLMSHYTTQVLEACRV